MHAKLKERAFLPSPEEIPPGLQPCLPLGTLHLQCQVTPTDTCGAGQALEAGTRGIAIHGAGEERLTVTSLHCMTGEVSADLITG